MTDFNPSTRLDPDPETILLIVVGSCLRAELSDRMLGYRLRERILGWQDEMACEVPEDIDLPKPEVPQGVEQEPPTVEPMFSTEDDWATATIKLKEVKNYVD